MCLTRIILEIQLKQSEEYTRKNKTKKTDAFNSSFIEENSEEPYYLKEEHLKNNVEKVDWRRKDWCLETNGCLFKHS